MCQNKKGTFHLVFYLYCLTLSSFSFNSYAPFNSNLLFCVKIKKASIFIVWLYHESNREQLKGWRSCGSPHQRIPHCISQPIEIKMDIQWSKTGLYGSFSHLGILIWFYWTLLVPWIELSRENNGVGIFRENSHIIIFFFIEYLPKEPWIH